MAKTLEKYYQALERLKTGRPIILPKGQKITYDAVCIEAGMGKGSIKKSRPVFAALIAAIDEQKINQTGPAKDANLKLLHAKAAAKDYRERYEAALGREVSLLREVYKLRKDLSRLTGASIRPIRGE